MNDRSAQSGYYQEIARAFLRRRGGGLVLSPKDQAVIAAWEEKRIPFDAVLEGIERTFDGLKTRGRATRAVPLSFCDREVEAAFAQHRERGAGRRKTVESPRLGPRDKARREIGQALEKLAPVDAGIARLLREALDELATPQPDEAALERIDAEIEAVLWSGVTDAGKAEAAAETRRALKGQAAAAGLEEAIRRSAVRTVRTRRRIPHVSLHYY